MAKVNTRRRPNMSRPRAPKRKKSTFSITANVKGRLHQKRIGGRMFYWNASEFSPEEAAFVAALLKEQFRALKRSTSPDSVRLWQDDNYVSNLRSGIEKQYGYGPFKHYTNTAPNNQIVQTNGTRIPFKDPLAVLVRDLLEAKIELLVGVFLEDIKRRSPSDKRLLRTWRARLRFGLAPFLGDSFADINEDWLRKVAENINQRKSVNGDYYKFNYRRDALRAIQLFIRFLQSQSKFREHLPQLPDLKHTLKASIRNTQKSLREERRFVVWNEESQKQVKSDIKSIIGKSDPSLKAFILLALNCGYLTSEIGHLTNGLLKNGVISWFRPKSMNRSPTPPQMIHYLWPETLKAVEAVRNTDRSEDAPLFVNKRGNGVHENDWVGKAFRKSAQRLRLDLKFQDLRKISATLVEHLSAQSGLSSLHLGHQAPSTSYKHYVSPEEPFTRLKFITDKIRTHLEIDKIKS